MMKLISLIFKNLNKLKKYLLVYMISGLLTKLMNGIIDTTPATSNNPIKVAKNKIK